MASQFCMDLHRKVQLQFLKEKKKRIFKADSLSVLDKELIHCPMHQSYFGSKTHIKLIKERCSHQMICLQLQQHKLTTLVQKSQAKATAEKLQAGLSNCLLLYALNNEGAILSDLHNIQNWLDFLIPETWNLWLEYALQKCRGRMIIWYCLSFQATVMLNQHYLLWVIHDFLFRVFWMFQIRYLDIIVLLDLSIEASDCINWSPLEKQYMHPPYHVFVEFAASLQNTDLQHLAGQDWEVMIKTVNESEID